MVTASLERRGSSRSFRYGYLVTTSPQSPTPPSTAPSQKGWATGFGCCRLSWGDGRWGHGAGPYLQTAIRTETGFLGLAHPHEFAALCTGHCSACAALDVRGMMT